MSEDWPKWRGPHRDGSLSSAAGPLPGPSAQLKWKLTVGEGMHLRFWPAEDFIFTRQQGKRQRRASIRNRQDCLATILCGSVHHESAASWHGEGPKSTPLFQREQAYTFGISAS